MQHRLHPSDFTSLPVSRACPRADMASIHLSDSSLAKGGRFQCRQGVSFRSRPSASNSSPGPAAVSCIRGRSTSASARRSGASAAPASRAASAASHVPRTDRPQLERAVGHFDQVQRLAPADQVPADQRQRRRCDRHARRQLGTGERPADEPGARLKRGRSGRNSRRRTARAGDLVRYPNNVTMRARLSIAAGCVTQAVFRPPLLQHRRGALSFHSHPAPPW